MTNIDAFVKLGRFMITHASQFVDDTQCNRWARVGQLLTEMGMPFAPKLSELGSEQIDTVREAAGVMMGKIEMPAKLVMLDVPEPRRTRKARMTKAMTKVKVVAPKTQSQNVCKVKKAAVNPENTTKGTCVVTIKPKRDVGVPSVASQVRELIRVNQNNTDHQGMVEIVVRELGLSVLRGKSVVKAFWGKVGE